MPIFGLLATIASLIIIVVGLPSQIRLNWKRKSCEGFSFSLIAVVFFSYLFWGLYGWTKPDTFLIIAQTPGLVLSMVLIFQFFHYGTGKPRRR